MTANTPEVLFRWLCAALLLSARIRAANAIRAARALTDRGWTTAQNMAAASWEERTRVLNQSGYARYDESAARMLGATADLVLAEHGGDLRKLRAAAGCDPARERALLKACKGVGEVGVDIYFRELQIVWQELYPFADRKARRTAAQLALPPRRRGARRVGPTRGAAAIDRCVDPRHTRARRPVGSRRGRQSDPLNDPRCRRTQPSAQRHTPTKALSEGCADSCRRSGAPGLLRSRPSYRH